MINGIMFILFSILALTVLVPFIGLLIDILSEYYKEVFTKSLLD